MAWEPNYTTTEDLAAYRRIGDAADDVQLSLAISAASRAIDRMCGRQFGALTTAAARYYTARWDARLAQWVVDIDDLMTTTDLAVAYDLDDDGTYSSAITDYRLQPRNAAGDARPWTALHVRATSAVQPTCLADGMKVTARWGWDEIPAPIEQACLLQASRFVSRVDAPFGIAGSPETGSEMRLLRDLDPDVAMSCRPFRRMWGAV